MEGLSFEERIFFSIYIQLVKLVLVKSLYTQQEKNRLVGNLPYRRNWEDIEVESQMYEKLMKNSSFFSEESFELKKKK